MKEIMIVLVAMALLGLASAVQIDPGVDEVLVGADGAYVELFGIDPWLASENVSFPDPVTMQNGTAVIGGVRG